MGMAGEQLWDDTEKTVDKCCLMVTGDASLPRKRSCLRKVLWCDGELYVRPGGVSLVWQTSHKVRTGDRDGKSLGSR